MKIYEDLRSFVVGAVLNQGERSREPRGSMRSAEMRGEGRTAEPWSIRREREREGGAGVGMYRFRRAIYRELATHIAAPCPGSAAAAAGESNHEQVLRA